MKRTKIVCTIGPASAKPRTLTRMMRAGMNVARLNLSHGTHASHKGLMKTIRRAAATVKEPVAILGDLQGPKIRVGELPESGIKLKKGQKISFTTATDAFEDDILPITYKKLHQDVKKGHRILMDDGLLEATVVGVKGRRIEAKVVVGGTLTSHKGMNLPDSELQVASITKKDKKDADFLVAQGVDWIALSFVTSKADVDLLRRIIKKAAKKGETLPRIIVKIERPQAIEKFEEILKAADAVMIARGDLGIEIPAEEVPVRQKEMIRACRKAGKPVVVATQMLDSMIRNPRPTRAEVSDVAGAVFDHVDAVMLSGETATGKYPVESVEMMAKIVEEAEESAYDNIPLAVDMLLSKADRASHDLKRLALEEHVEGLVAHVDELPWMELLMKTHPEIPFYLASGDDRVMRQNNLRWGVRPFLMAEGKPGTFKTRALTMLKKRKWISSKTPLALAEPVGESVHLRIINS